jgi:RNA polymerase sigma-70 factor (ECF subfamily)
MPVQPETEGGEHSFENVPASAPAELEAIWEEEWQANLLNAAIERVKRQVKEEHFLMFDRYVIKQLPAEETARTLGVSVGQVYLAKHRVSALIKKEVRALKEGL